MDNVHALLAPSSAGVWSQCPGSIVAGLAFPDKGDSPAAAEGTRMHDIAATWLEAALAGAVDGAPEDPAVLQYVDEIRRRVSGEDTVVGIEERVDCSVVHAACFGTVDAFIYEATTKKLTVLDFKYGRGPVEVAQNKQLWTYAAGLLVRYPEATTVELVIVQPRAFHSGGPVRSWITDDVTTADFAEGLGIMANEALGDNPRTVSGSHCRYCRMRWACPAAIEAGAKLYEAVGSYVPNSIDGEDLGALYTMTARALQHLEYLKAGLESEIEGRINAGKPVQGYRLKPTKGRKSWNVTPEQIIQLGELYGAELSKPGTVTPKQAQDLGVVIPPEYIKCESKIKLTECNAAEVFGGK